MNKKFFAISLAAVFALSACTNLDGTTDKSATATGTGALIGGLVGSAMASDGNEAEGALLGAAIGGGIGAVVGYDMEKQEAELRNTVGQSGASVTNTGDHLVVSLPENITFPIDSATVKSSLYGPLAQLAQSLDDYPQTMVKIIGHTDSSGADSYNQQLSQNRASAVAQILRSNGVAGRRLSTVAMGEHAPIATNSTSEGRQQNRRVEITIIPPAQ